jgi:hypothetical protein
MLSKINSSAYYNSILIKRTLEYSISKQVPNATLPRFVKIQGGYLFSRKLLIYLKSIESDATIVKRSISTDILWSICEPKKVPPTSVKGENKDSCIKSTKICLSKGETVFH